MTILKGDSGSNGSDSDSSSVRDRVVVSVRYNACVYYSVIDSSSVSGNYIVVLVIVLASR